MILKKLLKFDYLVFSNGCSLADVEFVSEMMAKQHLLDQTKRGEKFYQLIIVCLESKPRDRGQSLALLEPTNSLKLSVITTQEPLRGLRFSPRFEHLVLLHQSALSGCRWVSTLSFTVTLFTHEEPHP